MFEIKNLNDEFFSNLDPSLVLEIKELTTEDKVMCFRYFLNTDVITNVSVISNLFLLINGITDIDDDALADTQRGKVILLNEFVHAGVRDAQQFGQLLHV